MAGPWEKYQSSGPWDKFRAGGDFIGPPVAPQLTPLDRLRDFAASAGSGLATGAASLLDLPNTLSQLAVAGGMKVGEFAGLVPEGQSGRALQSMQDLSANSGFAGAVPESVAGYQPQTTAGEFAQTGGEFAAFAPLGGLAPMLASGLASEGAGQWAEGRTIPEGVPLVGGKDAEPIARIAAALGAPGLANTARRAVTPFPAANPERIRMANILADADVPVSAGQRTGSSVLRTAEGTLQPSQQQLGALTETAMRTTGSKAPLATGEAVKAQVEAVVKAMDDAVAGVSIKVPIDMAKRAVKISNDYQSIVTAGNLTPKIRGIVEEIIKLAPLPRGGPLPLSKLKEWRSNIGKLLTSSDDPTREAAHALRKLIDDATDAALKAAGRTADIAKLQLARTQYRNLLAVQYSVAKPGSPSALGITTPDRLRTGAQRVVGPLQYAQGGGTDLTNIARAGAGVLDTASAVIPGGGRSVQFGLPAVTAGAGGYLSGGSIEGILAGAMAPAAARRVINTSVAQKYLGNQFALPVKTSPKDKIAALLAQQTGAR